MQYLGGLKNDRMNLFPMQIIQHHSNPSLYTPATNAKEAEVEWFYETYKTF